jgi:hypothetical protein
MMSFLYLTLHPAIVYLHTNIKALCLKTNTLSLFFFKVSPLQPMLNLEPQGSDRIEGATVIIVW